ncbi:DUF3152 domain-containing protein [Streptomyces sp. NPDC090052]|uniref:DUF3152 domain-containing protein n=1 Tax=Streptomyces sp. NPDC090052 TaxID=3365931 RepID=UPI0037F43F64
MGRHSRRDGAPQGAPQSAPRRVEGISGDTAGDGADTAAQVPAGAGTAAEVPAGAGTGRRRRAPGETAPPQVRGGHPQQPEWNAPGPERYGPWQGVQQRRPQVPGPRKEFVEAFKDLSGTDPGPGGAGAGAATIGTGAGGPATGTGSAAPVAPVASSRTLDTSEALDGSGVSGNGTGDTGTSDTGTGQDSPGGKGGKGRAFAGIAAAAVVTVLAVVVAGQVMGGGDSHGDTRATGPGKRETGAGAASRGDNRVTPKAAPVPLTYTQKMSKLYPLSPKLKASGDFSVVGGSAKAPGQGHKYRYRVDIEKGMGLDGTLFADAVQKTLNDKRSWAHDGAKTFERISSGRPDFVITLASPVTTADWCAKSGLDTLEENVSCDSAATDRVMINAYRWAQGSKTYGDSKIYPYRQMLINHEVGHRLGHNHVSCRTPGALAPVMQQQTKSLDIGGIKCRANPWVYPTG